MQMNDLLLFALLSCLYTIPVVALVNAVSYYLKEVKRNT